MGKTHIEAFLSHLATHEKVAAATQRQALNALVFLYREVVFRPIEGEIAAVRAKRQVRVPVGTTREEVRRMLSFMSRTHLLMAKLMYGSGLRLMECVRLRVLDLDFGKVLVYVRGAKSGKDRVSLLPTGLHGELENHMNTNLLALSSPLDYLPGPLNGVALRMSGTPGSSMCV